jgi:hypothetical protein
MDLQRGVQYPFMDARWVSKLLLGALLSLVPILSLAATGYMYDLVRNVAAGHDTPLPEWDNLGDKILRGFLGSVIGFLWALPVLVLACPLGIISSISGSNSPNGNPSGGAALAVACLGILILLVALALAPLSLVAQARYAVTNNFGAALPGPVFQQVRSNLGAWITVFAAMIGIVLVVSVVAGLLIIVTAGLGACLVFPLLFVFGFYYLVVQGHWMGQAYRMSAGKEALPPSMV